MPIIRSPSNCLCSLWFPYGSVGGCVFSRGRLKTHPPTLPYGNQRLQRQFDGLLMMGIVIIIIIIIYLLTAIGLSPGGSTHLHTNNTQNNTNNNRTT
jgi:hypothetical protein